MTRNVTVAAALVIMAGLGACSRGSSGNDQGANAPSSQAAVTQDKQGVSTQTWDEAKAFTNGAAQLAAPDPELRKLDFLVGRWHLEGVSKAGPAGPGGKLTGEDSFEWLPGGYFLMHRWKTDFGPNDGNLVGVGYEFVGYDVATKKYTAHHFDDLGAYDNANSTFVGEFDGNNLVLTGPGRITRTLQSDGKIVERDDVPATGGTGWTPYLDATLTKIG